MTRLLRISKSSILFGSFLCSPLVFAAGTCEPSEAINAVVVRESTSIKKVKKFLESKQCISLRDRRSIQSENQENILSIWGQEVVGADLTRNFFKTLKKVSPVGVAIVDSPLIDQALPEDSLFLHQSRPEEFSRLKEAGNRPPKERAPEGYPGYSFDHGDRVANLIMRENSIGIAQNAFLSTHQHHLDKLDPVLLSQPPTQIVNVSMNDFPLNRSITDLVNRIDPKIPIVQSSGNDGILPTRHAMHPEEYSRVILVGNMAENGLIDETSSESEAVTIVAPGSITIQSWNAQGPASFGGTSAAAAVVSGALSNALSIRPGLTSDQLKEILVKTAVKIPSSLEKVKKNGAGMVNAYKIARVAERLANLPPTSDVNSQLKDPKLFDFESEADLHFERAKKLLDFSAGPECENLTKAVELLREAYLLSSHEGARKELIRIYHLLDLPFMKMFYQSLGSSSEIADVVKASIRLQNEYPSLAGSGIRSVDLISDKKEQAEWIEKIPKKDAKFSHSGAHLFHLLKTGLQKKDVELLGKEDLQKIAYYLPIDRKTRILTRAVFEECNRNRNPLDSGLPSPATQKCLRIISQFPLDVQAEILIRNFRSEKPVIDLMQKGLEQYLKSNASKEDVLTLQSWTLDRLKDPKYPKNAKEQLLILGDQIWKKEELDETVLPVLKRDSELLGFYYLLDDQKNSDEIIQLIGKFPKLSLSLLPAFVERMSSHFYRGEDPEEYLNERLLGFFWNGKNSISFADNFPSEKLSGLVLRYALWSKRFNESRDAFIGALLISFKLGKSEKKAMDVLKQFVGKWGEMKLPLLLITMGKDPIQSVQIMEDILRDRVRNFQKPENR